MREAIIIVGLLSLSIGSFLNACIYRIPRNISVLIPRSFCPHCRKSLSWCELIPVGSFLLTGGKCRSCHKSISPLYPSVELAAMGIGVLLFLRDGASIQYLWDISFILVMTTVAIIDWENLIIPNGIVVCGLVIGIVLTLAASAERFSSNVFSMLIAFSLTLTIALAGRWFFAKEAMGMGDVKLAGAIGFYLGAEDFLVALWLSALIGGGYGLFLMKFRGASKDFKIPFGSFLALVSSVVLIFSSTFDKWVEQWLIWLQ